MVKTRNNYTDDDYKYIGVISVDNISKIIDSFDDEDINCFSLNIIHSGVTYLINYFIDSSKIKNYEIIICNGMKKKSKLFNKYREFMDYIKHIFVDDDILVLLYMLYENNGVVSYPVTTNKVLSSKTITRSDELYLLNMPKKVSLKSSKKFLSFIILFIILNFFIGLLLIEESNKTTEIILGVFLNICAISSIIYLIYTYGYKTYIENGFITSLGIFKFKKSYTFQDINYIDDVITFNLFNTKKMYKIHMNDKRVVKLNYFNNSIMYNDDEFSEVLVYFQEQIINKKIKVNKKEKSNKILPIALVVGYVIVLIIL